MNNNNFEFDVIITTYNRFDEVNRFIKQILNCSLKPKNLFIIDSSDKINESLKNNLDIKYIRSSHKSQPYQRYLGVLASKSEYVILFDDDLIVKDERLFEYYFSGFTVSQDIVGVSVRTELHNPRNLGVKVQNFTNRPIKKMIYRFFGYGFPKDGKLSIGGFAGPLPDKSDFVEKFGGGNMGFRKKVALQIFDDYLFALFEKKLAMGEDKVICARALNFGRLYHVPKYCFIHPPIHSHYKDDNISFLTKTHFSRLWLSKEIAKAKNYPAFLPTLHFFYHSIMLLIVSMAQFNFNRFRAILVAVYQVFTLRKEDVIGETNYGKDLKLDLSNSKVYNVDQ